MKETRHHICQISSVHRMDDIRIFHKQCKSLVNAGYQVTLLSGTATKPELKHGVRIIPVDLGTSNRFKRMYNASSAMFEPALKLDADLYQFHDPELIPLGVKLKKAGKKVVFDSHEDYPADIKEKDWLHPMARGVVSNFYNLYEKRAIKILDGVISTTEKWTAGFKHPNSITIKNYPRLDYLNQVKALPKPIEFYGIYAGGLTRVRGIKELIKSLKFMPSDYKLVIAGEFDENAYMEECMNLPEWNKVEFMGFIPIIEVYEWVSTASIGYTVLHPVPGHVFSLPIKSFEYMALGVPVIMTEIPYWKDVFGELGVYVDGYNPSAIAEGALDILNNPERTKERTEQAKNCIVQELNWESEAVRLVEFYKNILE